MIFMILFSRKIGNAFYFSIFKMHFKMHSYVLKLPWDTFTQQRIKLCFKSMITGIKTIVYHHRHGHLVHQHVLLIGAFRMEMENGS